MTLIHKNCVLVLVVVETIINFVIILEGVLSGKAAPGQQSEVRPVAPHAPLRK